MESTMSYCMFMNCRLALIWSVLKQKHPSFKLELRHLNLHLQPVQHNQPSKKQAKQKTTEHNKTHKNVRKSPWKKKNKMKNSKPCSPQNYPNDLEYWSFPV